MLRATAPRVLGALVRRHGQFDLCEEAVQEALLAAATRWRQDGLPDDPRAWLTTVADRRVVDAIRSDRARRDREAAVAAEREREEAAGGAVPEHDGAAAEDDALKLLLLCCHPSLTSASQVALTLRAVGGLTTAEIARAFLVPEATMGQRISRAKRRIADAGARFELPTEWELPARIEAVRQTLYLIFNEGYTASSGPDLVRRELTGEAIRLTRELLELLPGDGETTGLLALMLLTDSHRDARTGPDGALVPLDQQDRARWDREQIDEGVALITGALSRAPVGPYQMQAAIAAVHAEAPTAHATDWRQIAALYRLLERLAPGPVVALNHAAAVAMAEGPEAGLARLAALEGDERLAGSHRLAAVRAHVLERLGDREAAARDYLAAARGTTSLPEQRYLQAQAARLAGR
nr:sigma-70 family RNA polymerase sigma factor [Conexibacter arvalis]